MNIKVNSFADIAIATRKEETDKQRDQREREGDNSYTMSSPTVQQFGGYSASGSRMRTGKKQGGAGKFAETNPRTLVGLQKSRVQLEKEITKLEKQAKTSVNNIANHQQAMKMSWRRLEQSRNQESPLLSRGGARRKEEERDKRHLGLLHSNTKLYVKATPSIYDAEGNPAPPSSEGNKGGDDEEPPTVRADRKKHPPPVALNTAYYRGSPYLSSPMNLRRSPRQPSGSGLLDTGSTTAVAPPLTQAPPSPPSQTTPIPPPGSDDEGGRLVSAKRGEAKLPPLYYSSQPMLVAHSNTVDKHTLMKASALMEGPTATGSQGPNTFKDFYTSERPPSRNILMSPQGDPPPEWAELFGAMEIGQRPEGGDGVRRTSSEPTLAELFEQIKHCRYIRHYHPDGTEVEEYM